MLVIIHCVGQAQDVVCPTPITGGALLRALGQCVAILANLQPLKDGQIHRTFRRVTLEDEFHLLDLSPYREVYTSERCFFARIEAAPLPQPRAAMPQGLLEQEPVRVQHGPPPRPDLRALYAKLVHTLPWPVPLPRPAHVMFRWNTRFRRTHGKCWPGQRRIEVSTVYQDARLVQDLEYLMTHEAAHFLWHGHPPAFKAFLRRVGIPEEYVHGTSSRVSAVYRAVEAERCLPAPILHAKGRHDA